MNDDSGAAAKVRPDDNYSPSVGVLYGPVGVVVFVLGGLLLSNVSKGGSDDFYRATGLAFFSAGAYLVIAGAVARGVQLARRRSQVPNHSAWRVLSDYAAQRVRPDYAADSAHSTCVFPPLLGLFLPAVGQ